MISSFHYSILPLITHENLGCSSLLKELRESDSTYSPQQHEAQVKKTSAEPLDRYLPKLQDQDKMCDWEEFLFVCNHSTLRLKSYCHFARNDPNHQCLGVKVLRDSWYQDGQLCDNCMASGLRLRNGIIWQLPHHQSSRHHHHHHHRQGR
ncbi:Uu.00g102660.m01.CDS01 [Anthostomella pinea]|uniref:Uu.00g102660.m01.CDS01 n=1 Tax=Anthostomella pinea TaxID=933095 RepID=A0AAI8VED9_9PEZI|nr:Uu.00g102660.m01.CDS01 [Anthostomella pinea]